MLEEKETYGLAVLDRKEATIATLKGKRIDILKTLASGVLVSTRQADSHRGGLTV